MSYRANVVSAIPIRFVPSPSLRRARPGLVPALDPLEVLLEREPVRDATDDLAGAVEVSLDLRQAHDTGSGETPPPAFLEDPVLVVDLVVAKGDDIRSNLVQDLEDVPLIPQDGAVHRLQRSDHLEPVRLGCDRRVLEPLRRGIARHDDDELVPELLRFPEKCDMPGVEKVEHARCHYPDHNCHASTTSSPSRKTRFRASAYSFASSLDRARPSSPIISQIVADGMRPAIVTSAVESSVWPRLRERRPSDALRRGTWPGDRNSLPRASSPHPFSWRMASPTREEKRAIVFARSLSVIPVRVSRWLIVIENGDAMGSYAAVVARVRARTG